MVEDAHWIDPTTLELIERCLEQHRQRAHAAAHHQPAGATSRSWPRIPSVDAAVAEPPEPRQRGGHRGAAGRRPACRRRRGPPSWRRADGVPLFVEELTKAVLETGEAAIPASLHGSLMARLDHIPEVKEVAQIAACIGREFDQALVQAVAERPERGGRGARQAGRGRAGLPARRQGQPAATPSSTRWCRRPPTRACCAASASSCMHASSKCSKPSVRTRRRRCSPTTPRGAGLADKAIGYWQAGRRCRAGEIGLRGGGRLFRQRHRAHRGPGRRRWTARPQELELQLQLGETLRRGARRMPRRPQGRRSSVPRNCSTTIPAKRLHVHFGLWAWYAHAWPSWRGTSLARTACSLPPAADGRDEAKLLAHCDRGNLSFA